MSMLLISNGIHIRMWTAVLCCYQLCVSFDGSAGWDAATGSDSFQVVTNCLLVGWLHFVLVANCHALQSCFLDHITV